MSKSLTSSGYNKCYFDNTKMYHLGEFFSEIGSDDIAKWLKNPINTGTEQIHYGTEGDNVKIYCNQFYLTFEQEEYYYDNRFVISFSKFVEAAKKWIELTAQKPEFIIIKFVNDDLVIEPDFREKIDINMENVKLFDEDLKRLLEPTVKSGLFYGGFHLSENKKNYIVKNKILDEKNTESCDFELENDYTFNHSFFYEKIGIEKFKEDFLNSMKELDKFSSKKNISYMNGKHGIFFLVKFCFYLPLTICIFDQKMNLLACFPLFEDIK